MSASTPASAASVCRYLEAVELIRDLGVAEGHHYRRHDDDLYRRSRVRPRAGAAVQRSLTADIEARGIPLGRLHAASTYTLFQHGNETWFDMVRVGMGLLGIYPDPSSRP